MFDSSEKRRMLSRWIIGTVACCILIYLGIRHIVNVAEAALWAVNQVKPLLIGVVLALILNVPMTLWESFLKKKLGMHKGVRALSITLSLLLVFGIFIAVAFLVIPELANALKLLVEILSDWLDKLARMDTSELLQETPFAAALAQIDIDWLSMKTQLEQWARNQSGVFVEQVMGAAGSVVSSTISGFIGLIFAIYIVSSKETLKRQTARLIRAWLPRRPGETLIHVCSVCAKIFRQFVAGQTIEAIILGTLCMAGMLLLQLPYAPMIGALVGVSALIPIVGAFVGTIVGTVMILTVSPVKAVVFIVFLLVLQQLEGNLIYPRVVGSKINLPAIWVLAAVTVGGNLAGPLGMLLGVPTASAGYALLKEATLDRERILRRFPRS